MPRLQVYLSDDLYQQAKEQKLPVSELLEDAIHAELSRRGVPDAAVAAPDRDGHRALPDHGTEATGP